MTARGLTLSLIVTALVCVLLVRPYAVRAELTFPATMTYQGAIESTSGGGYNSHGGTVLITFTTENELLRVEVRDFVYGVVTLPTYEERLSTINKTVYYNSTPPSPDGPFGAAIPLGEVGMLRSTLVLQGTVDHSTQVSGMVKLSCTQDLCAGLDAPFSANQIVETPLADTDTVFEAEVESGGTIIVAVDEHEKVTSLALEDVSFPDCPLDYPFNVSTFDATPAAFPLGFRVSWDYFLSVSGTKLDDTWAGAIKLQVSLYDDCHDEVAWSTAGFPTKEPSLSATTGPTPQPSPASPGLPATGSNEVQSTPVLQVILLTCLVLVLLGTGVWFTQRR